jgi:hypothetical protein
MRFFIACEKLLMKPFFLTLHMYVPSFLLPVFQQLPQFLAVEVIRGLNQLAVCETVSM